MKVIKSFSLQERVTSHVTRPATKQLTHARVWKAIQQQQQQQQQHTRERDDILTSRFFNTNIKADSNVCRLPYRAGESCPSAVSLSSRAVPQRLCCRHCRRRRFSWAAHRSRWWVCAAQKRRETLGNDDKVLSPSTVLALTWARLCWRSLFWNLNAWVQERAFMFTSACESVNLNLA